MHPVSSTQEQRREAEGSAADPARYGKRVLTGRGLGMLLGALDGAVISTVLPVIARELDGVTALPWLAGAYVFGTALAAPAWGWIGDRHGHRWVIGVGLHLLLTGTLLCAVAGAGTQLDHAIPAVVQLSAARLLQGIGSAAIFTATIADFARHVPGRRRAGCAGGFALIFAVATTVAPLAGGAIADGLHMDLYGTQVSGWRFIFLLQLPLILLAIALVGRSARGGAIRATQFDFAGLALVALFLLASALSLLHIRAGTGAVAVSLAGLALLALAGLPMIERRAAHPLLPPALMADPAIRRACFATACCSAALMSFSIAFPINLQLQLGRSATEAGMTMIPFSFGIAAGAIGGGRLLRSTGRIRELALVSIILAAACLAASAAATAWSALTWLVFGVGLGFGPLQSMHAIAVQHAAAAERQGSTAGMVQFFRRVGASLGAAAGAVEVAGAALVPGACLSPNAAPAGICIVFLLGALWFSYRMPREPLPEI